MNLRSFLYINPTLLDDYISAIDGFVYEEETLTTNKTKKYKNYFYCVSNRFVSSLAQYLRKVKIEKILVIGSQILLLVAFLGFWEFAADRGIIDSFINTFQKYE